MSRSAEASPPAAIGYAELHALSNFSFLRGASHPAELVERAHALGYRALALTDECSLAGVVRAHEALGDLSRREPAAEARSRRTPGTAESFQLIIGAEFHTACGLTLVLLAPSQRAYGQICQLITLGRRRSPKGEYRLLRADFESGLTDCLALWVPSVDAEGAQAAWLREFFPGRGWVAAQLHRGPDDARRLAQTLELARAAGLPAVAAGDVHMHVRARRRLQDALTAPSMRPAGHSIRTASVTCARCGSSRRCIRRRCWPRLSRSPSAATSRSRRCTTSTPPSWCPRAAAPVSTWPR